jgi:precorrin-6A/cobalt-precorrin-6A reductase
MPSPAATTILILGGTGEAMALARALAGDARFLPMLSLAGRTRNPQPPPIPWRSGGFGGAAGLAAFLAEHRFAALIDATHPFAQQISANARAAAASARVPHLTLTRPPWVAKPGERWTIVPDLAAAAPALGTRRRRVFLTIGRQDLQPFRAAPWHHYLIRSVDPPDPGDLPPDCEIISARGPFSHEDERALLASRRIDVLVCKNSGGAMRDKLDAAQALAIPVVMVARPPAPAGDTIATDIADALSWLARVHGAKRGV